MTRKFDSAREAAFLAALRASGNQTLSAERAKVSRSWVQRRRSLEPEFDAACREAIRAAGLGRAQGEREAPMEWCFLDGAELVVRGTGGSVRPHVAAEPSERGRPQIARARLRQWSPRAEERFLAALAATCNVRASCVEVGLSPASAYNHRLRWPAFARRWDAAIKLGHTLLECALIEAAGNLFSGREPAAPGPAGVVREMTADHAIHLLHMHKHRARGIGKRPGRAEPVPEMNAVRASILRKIAALERGAALEPGGDSAAERALRRSAPEDPEG